MSDEDDIAILTEDDEQDMHGYMAVFSVILIGTLAGVLLSAAGVLFALWLARR